jgi:uncharacterized protein YeaO (DUF488 family)
MPVKTKRVYENPESEGLQAPERSETSPADGYRVLVMRCWPRESDFLPG